MVKIASLAVAGLVLVLAACGPGAAPTATPTSRPAAPTAVPTQVVATVPAATVAPTRQPTATAMATPTAAVRATPVSASKPKGKIVAAMTTLGEEPLDPHQVSGGGTTVPILSSLHQTLVGAGLDGKFEGWIAEKWKLLPTGNGYELAIRQGVKFHNGATATAKDVKFSLERALRPDLVNAWRPQLAPYVDRLEAKDDRTLVIYTQGGVPETTILSGLSGNGNSIVPKDYVEQIGDSEFAKKPAGAGAFKFARRELGTFVEFEAFEDYFRQVSTVKTVVMRIVPEVTVRVAMLKNGEAEIIDGVAGPALTDVKSTAGLKIFSNPGTSWAAIGFHDMMKADSPLADKRVRQAFNLAVDKETMIQRILLGEGQPMAGMFPSFSLGSDPAIKAYPYDPQKAKELLAAAGYDKGLSVKLTYYPTPTSPMQAELMDAAASYLGKIGVKVDVVRMEAGGFLAMWRGHKHTSLAAIASGWGTEGGISTGTWLYSESPYAFFNFPRVDELFVKQKSEMDSAKRLAYLQEINRISYDEAPYIFLVWGNTIWGASARIVDWKLTPGGSYTPNFNLVRLKD